MSDATSSDRANLPIDSALINDLLINQIEMTIVRSVQNIFSKEVAKFRNQFWKRYAEDIEKVRYRKGIDKGSHG